MNGTYTGFNTSVVRSSQGAGGPTPAATDTAVGAGASGQSKPNGSLSSDNKLRASMLLALILVALGFAGF